MGEQESIATIKEVRSGMWPRTVNQNMQTDWPIKEEINNNPLFRKQLVTALKRYCAMDWGRVSEDDKRRNNNAVWFHKEICFAKYGFIWIITEWNKDFKATTTIMLNKEAV